MTNEILVIDDNSDIRKLISGILEDKGFKIREAANFDQAISEVNKKSTYANTALNRSFKRKIFK